MTDRKLCSELRLVLIQSGWSPNRLLSANELVFTKEKKLFPAFLEIAKEFGHLELHFRANNHKFYFDLDESEHSKVMRGKIFGYEDYKAISGKDEPDFKETEDFELTEEVSSCLESACARLGYLDNEFGFEVFIVEDGNIYWTHNGIPAKVCRSLTEFLNNLALGKKMYA